MLIAQRRVSDRRLSLTRRPSVDVVFGGSPCAYSRLCGLGQRPHSYENIGCTSCRGRRNETRLYPTSFFPNQQPGPDSLPHKPAVYILILERKLKHG